MQEIPNKAFTHAGRFHADDVFSAALLKILNPNIVIKRGFKVPSNYDGIVFDIGDGEFDHHAKNSPVRENKVPYAAFGLLWKKYGEELLPKEQAQRVDYHFIQPLDLDDNTGSGNQLAQLISAYNPAWDSDEDIEDCFNRAVKTATELLSLKIEGLQAINRAENYVNEALKNMKNGIVVLEKYAPWKQQLIPDSKAEFVIYPSQRGGFCAQAVPVSFSSNALKISFPAEWAGMQEHELKAISNLETLRFCHVGRFLVTTQTKEDAVEACILAKELHSEE